VHALRGVSLDIHAGRSLGVVGESGSGKSTLARLVMALDTPSAGSVELLGRDLHRLTACELRAARRDLQMVFQDPYGSLDPRQTVETIVTEPLQALANAIVRADKWIQRAGAGDIIKAVPESYLLGDRAVYVDAFLAARGALSPDGMIPDKGPQTAFNALASIDPEIARARIDLAAVYTNEFVKQANAKYPRG